ncbi:MAG: transporter substrate-binding protein [Patulibacter sp.]
MGDDDDPDVVRIGMVIPLTGGHGVTGRSMCRGALLAIEEVNAGGGIGGRRLQPVVVDSTTNVTQAVHALRGVLRSGVDLVLGAYTSAGRVAMLPAIREAGALLLYPTYYEGLEQEPCVCYAGAVPNQFLGGYIDWILGNLGRRFYMVGSDYVYPRTAGQIIQRVVGGRGGEVAVDRYVPLGQTDFAATLEEIDRLKPDVVLCNLVGNDSVPAFYRQFYDGGFRASTLPIAATVTTEAELQLMDPAVAAGHFMAASYFASLSNPANVDHRAAFAARFGRGAVTHVVSTAAYNAIWLLALAARTAGGSSASTVSRALPGTTFDGSPEGVPITVRANRHTTHAAHVGIAGVDGGYDVVASCGLQEPDPYPALLVPAQRRPSATSATSGA